MTRDSDRPEDDRQEDGGQGGFLSRWSRRKAEAREEKPVEAPVETEAAAEEDTEIDPATLPPIETLTEASDFSVFLKKGVPPALRAAALRKLWRIEPSVVNYEPLVDYNWDFTAPGYGELLPDDDVVKHLRNIFEGSLPKQPQPETDAAALPPDAPQMPAEPPLLAAEEPEAVIGERAEENPQEPIFTPPPKRRHGGALPD